MSNHTDADEVELIEGLLYRVPLKMIRFADDPSSKEFVNPRHAKGTPESKGLDVIPLKELKESIRENGVQNAPILHGTGNLGSQQLTINCGERRIRCINQLVKEDADCYDPVSKKRVKASVLYSKIRAQVYIGISIKEQYKLAFTNNETACEIGEGATITLVRRWRDMDWTDQEIMEVTNKSSTWLRDTDLLLTLDPQTFEALVDGSINRTTALRLAEINDPSQRLAKLATLSKLANERMSELMSQVTKSLEQAVEEQELAEANLADAVATNDKSRKKLADVQVKRANAKVQKRTDKVNEIKNKRVQATGKDMERLANETTGESGKLLTHAKIMKHWMPKVEKLISKSGKDESGAVVCSVADAHLVKMLIEHGIGRNEYNIDGLLNQHFLKHGKK